ncbi:glutaredoxin family protein [Arthrobacter sp. VKM Ac-2550]|uniref:glutaredoxin family protein n=1 Tax=Crystallibacter permensis TaxID=1938888 RepID=UPI0022273D91|nr:glutaredoxin family protein [Arthrobacter sp. VKM Ac-2550]
MKITVYTTPACGQCVSTKRWLDRNHADYNTVDLSKSPQDLAAVKALGYEAAPVVIVNDNGDTHDEKHWFGFRPDLLSEFCKPAQAAA